jgi:regulator of protease activity HflC (stomatin/prohibitin superfamily)
MTELITFLLGVAFLIILTSIRQINQYERGVRFTFGVFTGIMNPGWRIVLPVIQSFEKVDIRTKVSDVDDQFVITRDNVSVRVNAVIYYNVNNPAQAVIAVENFRTAVSHYAQTTMKNIVGETTLDELLVNREKIADRIREILGGQTSEWGLNVTNVELKDVKLSPEMERTIAKQAEAEREKRAVIINSEGELAAAEKMSQAAQILSSVPGALHLRTLQSINDISSDLSNTIIFAVPLEIMKAYEGFSKVTKIG